MASFNDYCNFVRSDLKNYKTIATKKASLTREIKALKDFKLHQESAYANRKRGQAFGWYLGDRVFKVDIGKTIKQIKFCEDLHKSL